MERDRRPLYLWLAFVVANVLAAAYYWPRLPALIAQHFGANGRPNGWNTKLSFLVFSAFMIALMGAVCFLLPMLLRRLPFALLNIPHKQYWSAPERQPVAWNMVEQQMNWMGVAVIAMQTLVIQLTLAANRGAARMLDNAALIVVLAAFGAFMIGWLVLFIRRFTPPA
jgi:uncharacterized membrane protein